MPAVTVQLESSEYRALQKLAYQERRNLRGQAAVAIRHELERLGLLPADGAAAPPAAAQPDPASAPAARTVEVEASRAAQPA